MRAHKPVIGLISREYPPHTHVGGIGTYTATAARLLADHGHETHVFCNGPETQRVEVDGVTVHRLAMGNHPLPQARLLYPYRRWFRNHLPHYLDSLTWSHTVADYLRREAGALRLEALEFPETNGEGARLDPDIFQNTRRVCRIHTSWIAEYVTGSLEARLLLRLQRQACGHANRVVSPSRHMAGHYARNILGWKNQVDVNPNPLRLWDDPIMWDNKRPNHVLFVGRVEHRKGLDLLLAAMESLGEKGRNWVLRVVGPRHKPDNPADAACQSALDKALATHGGIGRNPGYTLEYLGPVPHADLHRHFDWAGVVVMPSRQDNYPYTALEALSRGCFVLSAKVGGLPETLEGCQGDLFNTGDQDDLARKMGELGRNGDRVKAAWLSNAQAIAERFQPEACYLRLMKTYAGPQGALESSALPR